MSENDPGPQDVRSLGIDFATLVEPHRRELLGLCYRMLGSLQDAEDALQESLAAAWRGLPDFDGRSSLRTWLFRVTVNRCLNVRRSARRRPSSAWPIPGGVPIPPTGNGEVWWLEPLPDDRLDPPSVIAQPETAYETAESISLAFTVAVQLLPARQRAVLVLRDALGYSARDVASMLDVTEESVTSALKRARATLRRHLPDSSRATSPATSDADRALARRLATAFAAGDVDALVAMLADDVRLSMPPMPFEYEGRELARRFFAEVSFSGGRRYALVPTRANGHQAFGAYTDAGDGSPRPANGLLVVVTRHDQIAAITRFGPQVLSSFGLPDELPAISSAPSAPR